MTLVFANSPARPKVSTGLDTGDPGTTEEEQSDSTAVVEYLYFQGLSGCGAY
jgi:hypothetical protein